jgi:hypothetical protein
MAELKVIQLDRKPNAGMVQYAQELLERAEAGEVVEITAVGHRNDGSYYSVSVNVADVLKTIGALTTMLIDRVTKGGN